MKKITFLLFCAILIHSGLKANLYTTVSSGTFDDPAIWDCTCIPQPTDDVIILHDVGTAVGLQINNLTISNNATLTLTAGTQGCLIKGHLLIESGSKLINNDLCRIWGDYTLFGTHEATAPIRFRNANKLLNGTGTVSSSSFIALINTTRTTSASSNLTFVANYVILNDNVLLTNEGNLTLPIIYGNTLGVNKIVNASTGVLNLKNDLLSNFSIDATAAGNTVIMSKLGTDVQLITNFQDNTFHHLILTGSDLLGAKRLTNSIIINGNLLIETATLDAVNTGTSYNIQISGDWTNGDGNFNPGQGSVNFTGNTTINHFNSNQNFNDILITGTLNLNSNILVEGNFFNAGGTVNTDAQLIELKGNLNNSGAFNRENSLVLLTGLNNQTFTGNISFNDLILANGNGLNTLGETKIFGELTLLNGNITTNDNLIIASDANETGRIAPISLGGGFNGDIIVERYVDPSINGWHLLGLPVSNVDLASAWNDDFFTSGVPGSQLPGYWFASVTDYDEFVLGDLDLGLDGVEDMGNISPTGRGYRVYLATNPITVDVKGQANTGDVDLSISFTSSAGDLNDGWNLVSNPYASSIDWNSPNWIKADINDAIYVWDADLQVYNSYINGVGLNGGSNIVPSSQAFWVQSFDAGSTLIATQDVKTNASGQFKSGSDFPLIKLSLSKGDLRDEAAVAFKTDATEEFDAMHDAYKLKSENENFPNLSSLSGGFELGINSLPLPTEEIEIPLIITTATSGDFEFQTSGPQNFPMSSCLFLYDELLDEMIDISAEATYTFTIADPELEADRFKLIIGRAITVDASEANCFGGNDGLATAEGKGPGPWTFTWMDANENILLFEEDLTEPGTIYGLGAGTYFVQVDELNEPCGLNIETFEIFEPIASNFETASIVDYCNSSENGVISTSIINLDLPNAVWQAALYNENNELIYNEVVSGYFEITSLPAGEYSLNLTRECEVITSNYNLSDSNAVGALIEASQIEVDLFVNPTVEFENLSVNASNYLWDFGDFETSNEVSPSHTYSASGDYTVTLTAWNDNCEETSSIDIHVFDSSTGIADLNEGSVNMWSSNNWLNIQFNDYKFNDIQLTMNSHDGKLIYSRTLNVPENGIEIISMPEIAEGIYFVKLQNNEGLHHIQKIFFK